MKPKRSLARDTRGSAAAEMAFVLPLLLIIMLGTAELGNYFMNEHSLVKAVRDGARFAARQPLTSYTMCSGAPGGTVVADTRNVVVNGYLSTANKITPNIQATDINLAVSCTPTAGGQNMLGIYRSRFGSTCNGSTSNGCAQTVTVNATVNYQPIISALGFTGIGLHLNASSQAAVSGI